MITFNNKVAENLREIAALLKAQHANQFRCQAYMNAAMSIEKLPKDLRELFEEQGLKGLINLPTIGIGIAHLIYEYIETGRMSRLANLQGSFDSIALLQLIPTVGRRLAQRIYEKLHINSLASLENALHTGQLKKIEGLGNKRLQAIESWLSMYFTERNKNLKTNMEVFHDKYRDPSVELLLKLDSEYRDKANFGELPLIRPKRFNPENKAWLPIWHTKKKDWHFTVIFSNTERAHKFDRIYNWVIIFFYDSHHQEGHYTVVTETRGNLNNQRVVRGREDECRTYYDSIKKAGEIT
jgi:putative hydrolase